MCDSEAASGDEVVSHLAGADAVLFARGSGAARKKTVDRGAVVLCADAAERTRIHRYLVISAVGAGREYRRLPGRPARARPAGRAQQAGSARQAAR